MPSPLKIRADLRVNDGNRKLVLSVGDTETTDHLALKLGAYLLFWKEDLVMDPGSKHPALTDWDFRPDLLGVDITGSVGAWIECGNTSTHKLGKVIRRWPEARVVVVKESLQKARQMREMLAADEPRHERVQILAWPDRTFKEWTNCLSEKTEIFGESGDVSFNLVVNETVYVQDLLRL